MPPQNITPEQMQAAIAKNNRQTGRTTPYAAPPDPKADAILAQYGNPAAPPMPPPMPQVVNPEAPAPAPAVPASPPPGPQLASLSPAPAAPSPFKAPVPTQAAPPMPAPPSAPDSAQGAMPQIVAVGQPAPVYRMGMTGQMLPVGMSASPGAAYATSGSAGGPPENGQAADPIKAQLAKATQMMSSPLPAHREMGQQLFRQMQDMQQGNQRVGVDQARNQIEQGKLDLASRTQQAALNQQLWDRSWEGQRAAFAKSYQGNELEASLQKFTNGLDLAGVPHHADLVGRGSPASAMPGPSPAGSGQVQDVTNPYRQKQAAQEKTLDPVSAYARLNAMGPAAQSVSTRLQDPTVQGKLSDMDVLRQLHAGMGGTEGLLRNPQIVKDILAKHGHTPLTISKAHAVRDTIGNSLLSPIKGGLAALFGPKKVGDVLSPGMAIPWYGGLRGIANLSDAGNGMTFADTTSSPQEAELSGVLRNLYDLHGHKTLLRE